MREVRPGLIRVRAIKRNKIDELKETMIEERNKLAEEIKEKYDHGKTVVNDLQGLAKTVTQYVDVLRKRGIDVEYIRANAEQIKDIFFTVMELIENGIEETEKAPVEEGDPNG